MVKVMLVVLALAVPALVQAAPELSAAESARAQTLEVGATMVFANLPLSFDEEGSVRMRRVDLYEPDAKIFEVGAAGMRELPRSNWITFLADREVTDAPRIGFAMSPDGRQVQGLVFGNDGKMYQIDGERFGGGQRLKLRDAKTDLRGAPTEFVCNRDTHRDQMVMPAPNTAAIAAMPVASAIRAASRLGVVAIDTDNELLSQKFSGSTANATIYMTALFVGMNVVYERDLDLTLVQGTTLLRTAADPYTAADTFDQLDEVGEVWASTQAGTPRAFVAMISGKAASPNSSDGIAWTLTSPSVNYCTQTNNTFAGCTDGTCTAGHYSVSRVFKFVGSTAANDIGLVAHEIAHNFGADHTHCSNAVTGAATNVAPYIDNCFSGEGNGCFSGTQSCPAPVTVNGVANVRGTLMSYCHLNGIAGCTSSNVFAAAHRTLLGPKVTNNRALGCFTSGTLPNDVFRNGFE